MNFDKDREYKVNGYELYNLRYMVIISASLTSLMPGKDFVDENRRNFDLDNFLQFITKFGKNIQKIYEECEKITLNTRYKIIKKI